MWEKSSDLSETRQSGMDIIPGLYKNTFLTNHGLSHLAYLQKHLYEA